MLRFGSVFGLLFFLFLLGCSHKLQVTTPTLPQDVNHYLIHQMSLGLPMPPNIQDILAKKYLEQWYSPWSSAPNPKRSEVFWVAPSLKKIQSYGPNLKPYPPEEIQKIYDSMDMGHYPSAKIKAIITEDTAVRAVPSSLPRYKSQTNFPFDRWQNSLIFQGTPVLITHYNLTRDWAHIQSSFVYGWVKVSQLAKITDKDEKFLTTKKSYIIPNRDHIPIYDEHKDFLAMARMGEIFPIEEENKDHYAIALVYRRGDGSVGFKRAMVDKKDFSLFPKKLDAENMAKIIDSMMGQFYAWGGKLDSRDCSAFIRDSFANFGIYLPRNSAAQAKYPGNMVDLKSMTPKQKEQYILKNATPFATLLWLKGHIMLYLGEHEGRAVVAHSIWSVTSEKNFVKSENLFGSVVITTLVPAKNGIFSKQKTLLDRVLGMSDIYAYVLNLGEEKK